MSNGDLNVKTKNRLRWRKAGVTALLCAAALCCGYRPARAQVVLSSLQPSAAVALDGVSNAKPMPSAMLYDGKPTLHFHAESTVTYAVPAGQASFSGVIIFKNPPVLVSPDQDEGDRIRIRIYENEAVELDAVLDQASPPLRFNIPVTGASSLKISVLDFFSQGDFYLGDARFSQSRAADVSMNIPAAQQGFAAFNAPAQALLQKFVPGTAAQFTASYAGAANAGSFIVEAHPEYGGAAQRSAIPLHFGAAIDGIAVASGSWTVPQSFGPTLLDLSLIVNGKRVWGRTIRAALSPQLDLASVQDNSFGVHISESGYLHAQDEFAYLWNAKWARLFLQWKDLERIEGQFDFSRMDAVVNAYRAQHMKILMVLGESWPAWTGSSGPKFHRAWQKYVQVAVGHYRGKVDGWEPFNEIDAKWGHVRQQDPNWDIEVLKSSIAEIQQLDPNRLIICCSSATGTELDYQSRLLKSGVLQMVSALAIHPYEGVAPEEKEGVSNFLGRIGDLTTLEKKYGLNKPVWCTEAQWIMGKPGERYVTAPNINDQTQAEYVARVNMLAVPESRFFLHMPFFYASHRMEHVDTLAAYSFMASVMSDARGGRFLSSGPDIYGVTAQVPKGVAGGLWTSTVPATLGLTGLSGAHIFDMYGNTADESPAHFSVTEQPTYFLAAAGSPAINIIHPPAPRQYVQLPPAATWAVKRPGESVQASAAGVQVQTPVEQYGYDLTSKPLAVRPNSCYVVQIPIKLYRGSLMLVAQDASTHVKLAVNYISFRAGTDEPAAEIRFQTGNATQVNIVIGTANVPDPGSSQFEVAGEITMAPCRQPK